MTLFAFMDDKVFEIESSIKGKCFFLGKQMVLFES